MKDTIKVGYVGLGRRGTGMLKRCFSLMADVEITFICDLIEDRMTNAAAILAENGKPAPIMTTDYEEILRSDVDAVIIMTGWDSRPDMARRSLLAGKYTAMEVGCSATLEECFALIDAYEKTGTPLMMLENCCYGRREMMLLNIVKQGLFGEVIHCTGAYSHYLNEMELFKEMHAEDSDGKVHHYRLKHYIEGNRENYPTHAFGPICKVMNINRGNRLVKLSSVASSARGLKTYAESHFPDSEYAKIEYNQGDIVNTIITCADGSTIALCLDTTLPRAYYSRNFGVRGTKGMSSEERRVVFIEGMEEEIENNEKEMFEKYDHPLHAEYEALGTRGGHGGMDWLVCRAFVEAVKAGTNTPIDAYDSVTWLSIGALTEKSIAGGGVPVEIPDFTNGKWKNREPVIRGKYCLDEICEDRSVRIFDDIE